MTSTAQKRFFGTSALSRTLAGLAMVTLGIAAAGLPPTTAPATSTASAPATHAKTMPAMPTVNVDVTEWVVFVTDISSKELNRREGFDNMLPSFVNDSRREPKPPVATTSATTRSATMPSPIGPIGIIRITPDGKLNTDAAIDVLLGYKNGRILGHWPTAKPRPTNLLWQDVHFATTAEKPKSLPEGSWLAEARSAALGNQMLTCGAITEPFLLYDFELNYEVRLQVTGGENGKYKVAHSMAAPMQNLTLYKRDASGKWRTAALETLSKSGPVAATAPATSTGPATTRATTAAASTAATKPATAPVAESPPRVTPRRGRNATAPADETASATTIPSAPAILLVGEEITLGSPDATEETVFASWRVKLAAAGVSSADQQIILKILAKYALDPKRLTAIYRMDPAEFDKLLPLEVVPQPKKTSRIALVVVTGIDPAMGDELSQLITQLGDKSWEKREAAMADIQKIGARAKQQLEKAAKDKDMEIAYRAEQLLQVLSSDTPEKQDPNQ